MAATYADIRIAGGDTGKPLAMAKRLAVIKRHLEPGAGRFLDCGCGAGDYVLALVQQCNFDAHGIEFDKDKVLRAHAIAALRTRVTQGDLQKIEQPADSWDYAMLNEVLEHVPDDRKALHEVHRILKPGGILFIFSPNRWFPFETHGVRRKKSRRPVPHWFPFVPYLPLWCGQRFFEYWARNYWQGELAALATSSGFAISERSFVWLTFENISGSQPALVRIANPLLRLVSNTMERLPLVRRLGVSQVLVCRKH